MLRIPSTLAFALILAACGGLEERSGRAEPPRLVLGSIWQVEGERAVSRDHLLRRLADADYVLLGEKHDNARHHALQAEIVAELQRRGDAPRAVAFEMMGTDQQLAVVEHLAARPGDASGLGAALDWADSGWPDWAIMYAPIAQAALDGGGEIVAANLPRDQIRAVYGSGPEALRPALVERSGLAERLPEVLEVDLRNDLVESHCGHAAGDMVEGMFRVQRARDAVMADRLVATSGVGGGVLIAGAQHVRTDRGVPWYLARLEPGADVVSLAFLEADERAELPDDLPFDYVWLTGPAADEADDPCETFRRSDGGRRASAASG